MKRSMDLVEVSSILVHPILGEFQSVQSTPAFPEVSRALRVAGSVFASVKTGIFADLMKFVHKSIMNTRFPALNFLI